jgi:hypothetical protein
MNRHPAKKRDEVKYQAIRLLALVPNESEGVSVFVRRIEISGITKINRR